MGGIELCDLSEEFESVNGVYSVTGLLFLQSISNKCQTVSFQISLQLKQWYFICITHNTQRALSGGNIIKVYLDGELAATEKLRSVILFMRFPF